MRHHFTWGEVFERTDQLADHQNWNELIQLYDALDAALADAPPDDRELRQCRARVARVAVFELPADRGADAVRILEREYEDGLAHSGALWETLAHVRVWEEVGPHLRHPLLRHLVAHARVLRGEDLAGADGLDPGACGGVPLALAPWEAEFWDAGDHPGSSGRSSGGAAIASLSSVGREGRTRLPAAGGGAVPVLAAPEPLVPGAPTYCFVGVSGPVACDVHQATARYLRALPAHERPSYATPIPFAAAYPDLVLALGGSSAYGTVASAALGRIALWRMLRRFAGLSVAAPAADVSAFVAGLTCLTWELSSDEIWFLHLAIGHGGTEGRGSVSWIVDGQDVD
ncbi:hypothetical protein A8W25_01065 [Streptomyces sp. ERV7]|uniref:hypothetical protein n=1 Tax=Streptomyces sp. ERV7 TaxID=1322334 RepID=UPI0007F32A81|nr:hypothetical protein [Streptomyces sp. ERV7]OAR26915.1 hypothetical protein A8W25_01065 [Streptomyces sp. ERV7]